MLVGGVMTAALAVPNANPFGADNMFGYMNGKQMVWLSGLAFLFLYVNLGSVCSHCLYNAATGWSRILGNRMRLMAVILGAQDLIRPNAKIDADWRPEAFIAWAVGSVCAFVVEERMAFLSTAISAALVASIVYYVIAKSRSAQPAAVKSR